MRNTMSIFCALLFISTATTGCFVSRKETVREVPKSTTVERSSTVQTIPQSDEVRTRTTVEKY